MSSANPDYARVARRMLTHETAQSSAEACAMAVRGVHQKLHYRMVPLIGATGMGALFARSVRVTAVAFPELGEAHSAERGEHINISDSLVQLIAQLEPRPAWAAATALYANFLGLTSALIGERLVLLVLQRAFPNIDVAAKQESE